MGWQRVGHHLATKQQQYVNSNLLIYPTSPNPALALSISKQGVSVGQDSVTPALGAGSGASCWRGLWDPDVPSMPRL